MMLCDPGTARFKSVYMQAWVRESMIKNNPDKSRRRGGWKVKPRQYIRWRPLDEDIMCRKDYWEWDTEKCNWWSPSVVPDQSGSVGQDSKGIMHAWVDRTPGIGDGGSCGVAWVHEKVGTLGMAPGVARRAPSPDLL